MHIPHTPSYVCAASMADTVDDADTAAAPTFHTAQPTPDGSDGNERVLSQGVGGRGGVGLIVWKRVMAEACLCQGGETSFTRPIHQSPPAHPRLPRAPAPPSLACAQTPRWRGPPPPPRPPSPSNTSSGPSRTPCGTRPPARFRQTSKSPLRASGLVDARRSGPTGKAQPMGKGCILRTICLPFREQSVQTQSVPRNPTQDRTNRSHTKSLKKTTSHVVRPECTDWCIQSNHNGPLPPRLHSIRPHKGTPSPNLAVLFPISFPIPIPIPIFQSTSTHPIMTPASATISSPPLRRWRPRKFISWGAGLERAYEEGEWGGWETIAHKL